MIAHVRPLSTLLLGLGVFLIGTGMVGTLLGLRGNLEGFSNGALGVVMSSYFAGYVVGVFVCPKLIHAVGHIRSFAVLAASIACLSLLYGLLPLVSVWLVLRFVNGVAIVGIFMVIESWLNERTTEGRATVFAAYMMVCLFSQGLGQYLLLIYGPGSTEAFALVAVFLAAGLIPIALTPVPQPAPVQVPQLSFRHLYEMAPVGVAGAVASGVVTGAFWGLAAPFAMQAGLATEEVVHFVAAAILCGVLVQWPIGRWSDRHDRRWVMVGVSLMGGLGAAAMAVDVWGWMGVVAASSVFGAFSFTLYGLAVAQTHDRFAKAQSLEATKGLLLLHGAGAVLGPLGAGWAMEVFGAQAYAPFMAGLLVLLAIFVLYRIRIDAPVPAEDRTVFIPVNRNSSVAMEMDPRVEH